MVSGLWCQILGREIWWNEQIQNLAMRSYVMIQQELDIVLKDKFEEM